jgi:hypothetical protein
MSISLALWFSSQVIKPLTLSLCFSEPHPPQIISRTFFLTYPALATLIIDIVAIIMTAIMIYHIKSKYTAVGT